MTDPRGIRSNNPLNIDFHAGTKWQGMADPPSDGRFVRFTEPQWGIRAAIKILESYQKRGITTVRQTIFTWAPPTENLSEAYLSFVCRKADVTPETVINLDDRDLVIRILKAMVLMECGKAPPGTANGNWLDDAVFASGYSLARPLTKSRTMRGSGAAIGAAAAGAIIEAATEVLPQAADAAAIITPLWPEIARWVLIAVVIAGAGLALYSRLEARKAGIR